jgi:Phosphoglycerate dehydrogenase and related dehydrogenases
MEKLKWIQLSSIGIDQLPKDVILRNKITVTNNRGGYKIPIGEWIVMDILNLLKGTRYFHKNQLDRKWKLNTGISELYGKTICFIGTGNIAIEAAKRLRGFEVNLLGVNTNGRNIEYFNKCYEMDQIDYVLAHSDIIVLTLPYTKETHGLIDAAKFASMKDGVLLVNIARGAIVDEKALIENLERGKIGAAALDVFTEEPLSVTNPLWNMDNVIITPHNSWASEGGSERFFTLFYENLKRYINNEVLLNVVDLARGY